MLRRVTLAGMVALLLGAAPLAQTPEPAQDDSIEAPQTGDAVCPISDDETYGFLASNPVMVGGEAVGGPARARAYLDNLRGPGGEPILYERAGSIPADGTFLDLYSLTYPGGEPLGIHIDQYFFENLRAPLGLICADAFVGSVAVTQSAPGAAAQDNPVVVMETSLGDITIELLQSDAPKSVENFLAYVNDGFFEGTVFHRVIQQFMIQGGGMTADLGQKRTRQPIQNEARNGVSNARGTVAMARTNAIDSGTSQFFINTVDNARDLDHSGLNPTEYGYAVFGRVTDGMDVVDAIAAVETETQEGFPDVPVKPVTINLVTLQ